MKSSFSPSHDSQSKTGRPGLVCRVVRFTQSWHEEDSEPRGMAGRHAENCADCADYFARAQHLERALVAENRDAAPAEIPAGLEDRIWAAVRPEVVARREPAKPAWRADWRPILGGAIAAALVVAVWLGQDPTVDRDGVSGQTVVTADALEFNEADMQQLVATVESFSTDLLTASTRNDQTPAQPNVLEQELEALGSDARGALRFLGQNFLPSVVRSREEV